MCGTPTRVILLLAALLIVAPSCRAYVSVPLPNGDITTFDADLASDWSAFVIGSSAPILQFYPDSAIFRSAPYSQGILGIDQLVSGTFGAGIIRQVSAVPDRVYLLVGYQDLYAAGYLPPPARRYAHFFGVGTHGGSSPPVPFTMGEVSWMGPGQWFYNDMAGNSTQIGGMHRCMAAWPARNTSISLWSGVHAYGEAPASSDLTTFATDAFKLFEYDNAPQTQLQNPGFETVENLTPGLDPNDINRITLPASWVPVGGGIGQKESYYTDSYGKRGGAAGLRIYNHRGLCTRGVMQRVFRPPSAWKATFTIWVRSNKTLGTVARVGIDPAGGDDLSSASIVWTAYDRTDETWAQVSVTAPCAGSAITLFLCASSDASTTGSVHYADFDDAALSFEADSTPPEPFGVIAESPATLTTFLSASVLPVPHDPETGIVLTEYAVGTTPGGQEVRPFTTCADPTVVSAPGLSLAPGTSYYVTVRATNGAGLSTTASSGAILCSPRPYTYSWHDGGHLSQTSFSADNVRLAAGVDMAVYAVWRESLDPTWDGADSRVVFRERADTVWSAPAVVNSSSNAWWPDVAASAEGVIVTYATPGNELWNDLRLAVRPGSSGFADQPVLSDVAPFPRIACTQAGSAIIGCMVNTSGEATHCVPSLVLKKPVWTAEALPGGRFADNAMRVAVACLGSTVQCLWSAFDDGEPCLFYCRRDPQGAYSTPHLLARGVRAGSIAASTNSAVSVVYERNGGIWFAQSADGEEFGIPQYLGQGAFPSVAAEPNGRVHVLFYAPTGIMNEHGVAMVVPTHIVWDVSGWSYPAQVCPPSCTSGSALQQPGNLAVDSSGGLHFAWSNNPHDPGWQMGRFLGYYWIDYHTTVPIDPQISDIAAAKLWGDDLLCGQLGYPPSKIVSLAAKEVTAVGAFGYAARVGEQTVWKSVPCFYVQEGDRSSGIRVIAGDARDIPLPPVGVRPGDLVNVTGIISTIDGERTIGRLTQDGAAHEAAFTVVGSVSNPVSPVGMRVKDLGGAAVGPTLGVTGGLGANNVGLLVRVVGTVVSVSNDERGVTVLYIDDGSNTPCGSATGVKVYAPGASVQVGDLVVVTGVSSVEQYDSSQAVAGDESLIRVVMPRDGLNVEVVGRAP
jgi:hypothetical protein